MLSSNLVSSFYYSNFIAAISGPYTNLNAYRAGVIDSNGNILKPESSIDSFEYLIIKLKKIFEQLPAGTTKAKLNQYAAAFQLFSEEASSFGMDKDTVELIIEGFLAANSNGELSYIELKEDMTSGNLGGPSSSPAQNTGAVSGFDAPMGQPMTRKLASLLGMSKQACEIYDVCPEDFDELSNPNLKSWDEVPDSETKRYMQRSQRRSGGPMILIRDSGTNRMHKLNLKPRNLSKIISENTGAVDAYNDADDEQGKSSVAVLSDKEEAKYDIPEELHPKISEFIHHTLTMRYRNKDGKDLGPIINRKDSHAAELHGRMLLFAKGLEHISKISDTAKRHSAFASFINAVHGSREKNPSVADEKSTAKHPDAWAYHPEHGVIQAEIKTNRYEGQFPTPLTSSSTPEQIEQEKQRHISNFQQQWRQGVLVRRNETGRFLQVSQQDISPLWSDYPGRIVTRRRGKSTGQRDNSTAGNTLKIISLRSLTSKLENPVTINQQTIDLLKQHTDKTEHHSLLGEVLGKHV